MRFVVGEFFPSTVFETVSCILIATPHSFFTKRIDLGVGLTLLSLTCTWSGHVILTDQSDVNGGSFGKLFQDSQGSFLSFYLNSLLP